LALLLDNDVVHKLAQLDMLDEAISSLNINYGDIFVLETLRYKFCHPSNSVRRRKQENKYGKEVIDRIELFISQTKIISEEVTDPDFIDAMNDGNALDIGEMQLLSALFSSENDDLLFTGDKRFLRALSERESLAEKLNSVSNRFVSFEQIVMLLIERAGFDQVQSRVLIAHSNGGFDKTLRCCFEGLPEADSSVVCVNIRREVLNLSGCTGDLLCTDVKLREIFPYNRDCIDDCDSGLDFMSIPQS
jgi:hypothetical protein